MRKNLAVIAAIVVMTVAAIRWTGAAALAADRAVAAADAAEARADSIGGLAAGHVRDARRSLARASETRRAQRALPVPDSCVAVAAERDSLIDTLFIVAGAYDTAVTLRDAEAAALRAATDSLRSAARRPFWKPEVGMGPFLGVCADGKPCAGVGVTLSWRIP